LIDLSISVLVDVLEDVLKMISLETF